MYEKPLPPINEVSRFFWENCKKHKLVIQKCNNCGQLQYFPRRICANCWSESLGWILSKGKGTVYSYTVVRRAPLKAFEPDVPFSVALIDLDEGVTMVSSVIGCKPDDVRIGMPVAVMFEDVTGEVSLPKFAPIRES